MDKFKSVKFEYCGFPEDDKKMERKEGRRKMCRAGYGLSPDTLLGNE